LPERLGECWGGLGLIVVDASGEFSPGGPRRNKDLFDQSKLVWPAAHWVRQKGDVGAELFADISLVAETSLTEAKDESAALAADLQRHRAWLRGIEASASWRITSPLRTLKRRLRRSSPTG
jgi:hypothetical protein